MKSSDVSNALTGIIALCCLVLTGTALQRQFFAPAPRSVVMGPEAVPDWSSYARDGQRMGPASARVTITEFSDYQCPFCKKFNTVLHQVRAAHPNDVAVVYTKQGPIVISIFTWDNQDQSWAPDNEAYLTIAKLAAAIVQAWSPGGLDEKTGPAHHK